jgi:hypothetical protein
LLHDADFALNVPSCGGGRANAFLDEGFVSTVMSDDEDPKVVVSADALGGVV